MSARAVAGRNALVRMRAALVAAMVVSLTLALSTSARAATITVNSLADRGAPGICVLRDAITAANTRTATNGCVAGDGNDTIQFNVRGTIALARTLPQVTDSVLAINGPASPGIRIDGGGNVQVMIVASGATVRLRHLTIAHGNTGRFNCGGGIYNLGTLTVAHSSFSRNSSFYSGGGICNAGTLTVTHSIFFGNQHEAISNIFGSGAVRVNDSTFSANSDVYGGAIGNNNNVIVINCTFSGNTASHDGGGIYNFGLLTVIRSTFSNNSAPYLGGAIYNGSVLTVTTSTFSSNRGGLAGGISNIGAVLTVTNSTFSGNPGGAIANASAVARLKSTILAASGIIGNCFEPDSKITDVGYNISDDNSCEFSATGSLNISDPMLDPNGLQNNGGLTKTIALLIGSPAIDAIPRADCKLHHDQRGFPRPDNGESACDIGAYEFQDAP